VRHGEEVKNVFAAFYHSLTGSSWPFEKEITIEIGNVLPYCEQISVEILDFYDIPEKNIRCMSLVRPCQPKPGANQQVYEFVFPKKSELLVQHEVPSSLFIIVDSKTLTESDRDVWFDAYGFELNDRWTLLRSSPRDYQEAFNDIHQALQHYVIPHPVYPEGNTWTFVPKINICDKALFWHPLLSDYLFSYVISIILRYYPHLVPNNENAAYIAEAWCKQSAQMALRYFLLEFTDPGLIILRV